MVEADAVHIVPKGAEWVNVAVADARPVPKLNAQFECRAGSSHELSLVDTKAGVERAYVRQRGLPHPHNPDFFGLD
jgi:hypothetical protein